MDETVGQKLAKKLLDKNVPLHIVNSLSYADDMVTPLEVCHAFAGPHDIVWSMDPHNENGMYAGPTKVITGSVLTRVRLGNEELRFAKEFRYLGYVMTADCQDDKDIKKQFRRQNTVGNMLVRKFSFAPMDSKIRLFKSYCYPIDGCALWRHS